MQGKMCHDNQVPVKLRMRKHAKRKLEVAEADLKNFEYKLKSFDIMWENLLKNKDAEIAET